MASESFMSPPRPGPITVAAAERLQTKFKENLEASRKNELRSRPVAALTAQQTGILCQPQNASKLTKINGSWRQLELTDCVNTPTSSPITTNNYLKVVYWSDRQSTTPKTTGIPNVPPVTPSSCK